MVLQGQATEADRFKALYIITVTIQTRNIIITMVETKQPDNSKPSSLLEILATSFTTLLLLHVQTMTNTAYRNTLFVRLACHTHFNSSYWFTSILLGSLMYLP